MKSIIFIFFISYVFASQSDTSNEQLNVPEKDDAAANGYQLLLGADKDSVGKNPHFFKSYGKLGVNYDIDKGQPFIWCEV
jgi:hypothetical protein